MPAEGGLMALDTDRHRTSRHLFSILAASALVFGVLALIAPAGEASTVTNGKISFGRIDVALDVSPA